ncbi:MAG: beta-lactamase family protein [Bacteroidales bacterium]|nr:beta-lactamase family protein [Bacteroidales bacterium]MCI2144869.1 beta-lactamase family protein [Bacteroidales bacterium]
MKRSACLLLSALIIPFCIAFTGCSINVTQPKEERADTINLSRLAYADSAIDAAIADRQIPGAVLCIVEGDDIKYLKAYGYKEIVPDSIPMTTNTVFDLASLSKCVGTTLSFMQLLEEGKVRLSDPVKMYIPGFKPWYDVEKKDSVDITIEDLMTHTSGIIPYINVDKFIARYGTGCPDSLIKYIATEAPRRFRPKTGYLYSCLNFITLQRILENVTGEKLCDYAQKHVFDVLDLKNTYYCPTPDKFGQIAPATYENGKLLLGEVHDPTARIINLGNSGNAGVFSSAEDMAVIARAIMDGGEWKGKRILGKETVKAMCTVPENVHKFGRTLGWDAWSTSASQPGDILTDRTQCICHTGYTGTSMVIDFKHRIAIILLTNRVHPDDSGSCSRVRALVANIVEGALE